MKTYTHTEFVQTFDRTLTESQRENLRTNLQAGAQVLCGGNAKLYTNNQGGSDP